LTIYDEADARVGFVILYHLESDRLVELVRIVSEKKGQGIGTATLKVVQDMAFNQLDAHRLQLDVFEHNEAALRVYRSAGFTTEGVLRDPHIREGRFVSIVIMSMLEHEFRSLQE
jgi:RimJ/RimL family protein N-acetyltransferase